MNLCIVTECALARTHGTGAHALRVFEGSGHPFFHFYLRRIQFGLSECPNSHLLEDVPWPWKRQRVANAVRRVLGKHWWAGDRLNHRRLSRLIRDEGYRADAAYVIVAREDHAAAAAQIVDVVGCPYVLHVVDLYHEDGLDPAAMPGFSRLIDGASSVLALTDTIRDELTKFGRPDINLQLCFGQGPVPIAAPPEPGGPLEIITVGAPYDTGARLLAEAWDRIKATWPAARVRYVGKHFGMLPEAFRRIADDCGYVSDAEYERILASSHLAVLKGPWNMDCYGRFSLTSRIGDLTTAGLPIVSCAGPATATGRFLDRLVPTAARAAGTAGELVAGIEGLAGSPAAWAAASAAARRFAAEHFELAALRQALFGRLHAATGGGRESVA